MNRELSELFSEENINPEREILIDFCVKKNLKKIKRIWRKWIHFSVIKSMNISDLGGCK